MMRHPQKEQRLAENSGLPFDHGTSREPCRTADIGEPIALFVIDGESGRQTQPCLDITCCEADGKAARKRFPSVLPFFVHKMVQARCSGKSTLDVVCYQSKAEKLTHHYDRIARSWRSAKDPMTIRVRKGDN